MRDKQRRSNRKVTIDPSIPLSASEQSELLGPDFPSRCQVMTERCLKQIVELHKAIDSYKLSAAVSNNNDPGVQVLIRGIMDNITKTSLLVITLTEYIDAEMKLPIAEANNLEKALMQNSWVDITTVTALATATINPSVFEMKRQAFIMSKDFKDLVHTFKMARKRYSVGPADLKNMQSLDSVNIEMNIAEQPDELEDEDQLTDNSHATNDTFQPAPPISLTRTPSTLTGSKMHSKRLTRAYWRRLAVGTLALAALVIITVKYRLIA